MRGNFITDKNGSNNPNYKDGRKGTRLYRIYNAMKTRCYNEHSPTYKNYGGRGITICEEWKNNFKAFHDWGVIQWIPRRFKYRPNRRKRKLRA